MKLGELIEHLKQQDQDANITFDFPKMAPCGVDSYRGDYEQLALEYKEYDWENKPKVSEVLAYLEGVLGKHLTGYKGGQYLMHAETTVWVANYSETSECGISGIIVSSDGNVIIQTTHQEYEPMSGSLGRLLATAARLSKEIYDK